MEESASEVRPEHSGPVSSLRAPIGKPPSRRSSSAAMPVGAVGRMSRGAGVSAEGMRAERADSMERRRAAAEGIQHRLRFIFAYLEIGRK